jgi:hypothetical protein
MAVRVIRENNRTEGLKPATGVTAIIAGQPLVLATATTVKPYDDGSWLDLPFGIAAESTAQPPIAPMSGQTAGEGFDYTNFARGGLVSAFTTGSILELFDDGRGAPYEAADTYVLNRPVYAKENGKVTSVGTGPRQKIGVVLDFEGSPVTRLRVKFDL